MATVEDLHSLERMIRNMDDDKLKSLLGMKGLEEKITEKWSPNPGQQTLAMESPADEIFYGGTAGGGKTDLLLGATFKHIRSLILRRTNKEASRFIRRYEEMTGGRDGWNGMQQTFSFPDLGS